VPPTPATDEGEQWSTIAAHSAPVPETVMPSSPAIPSAPTSAPGEPGRSTP
jgi:hypothetical protein